MYKETEPHFFRNGSSPTYQYTLGQAKIFGATCLTQDCNQNGQEQLWQEFQKASLKNPKSTAVFLYLVKLFGYRGATLKSQCVNDSKSRVVGKGTQGQSCNIMWE